MPPTWGRRLATGFLLVRAVGKLLETAFKFSSRGSTVRLQAIPSVREIALDIEARGFSVPAELLPYFFDVLAIGKSITPGGDLGLSAALAAQIINLLGGKVEVANLVPTGIRLSASLPRYKPVTCRQEHKQNAWRDNASGISCR